MLKINSHGDMYFSCGRFVTLWSNSTQGAFTLSARIGEMFFDFNTASTCMDLTMNLLRPLSGWRIKMKPRFVMNITSEGYLHVQLGRLALTSNSRIPRETYIRYFSECGSVQILLGGRSRFSLRIRKGC